MCQRAVAAPRQIPFRRHVRPMDLYLPTPPPRAARNLNEISAAR